MHELVADVGQNSLELFNQFFKCYSFNCIFHHFEEVSFYFKFHFELGGERSWSSINMCFL